MNENKASRYHRLRRRTQLVALVMVSAALAAFTALGGGVWLRDVSSTFARVVTDSAGTRDAITVGLVALGLTALLDLAALPGAVYRGTILDRRYGLTRQTSLEWWRDWLKSMALGAVLSVAVAATVYLAIGLWPAGWWLLAGVALAGLAALMALVAPILLFPMFYRFTPLPDGDLANRLTSLAQAAGVPVLGAYQWSLGDKSATANAALVGMGPTRRILLSDTLLEHYSPDEIEVIIAHELAHHVHGDIWKGVLAETAAGTLALGVAHVALLWAGSRLGVEGLSDPAGMPLLALVAGAWSMLIAPLLLAQSREHERRADRFALTLSGKPDAFVSAMRRLGEQNLAEESPSRVIEWLFHSHPPLPQRIAAAMRWKMENPREA
jgi:STE24 endopeptidase